MKLKRLLADNRLVLLYFFLIVPTLLPVQHGESFGPNNATCYEIGNCDFFENPFDTMILPYQEVFDTFTYVILWSVIIGILWLRLGNTMAVGLIGLTLAILFQDPLQTGVGFSDDAQLYGYLLLGAAIGIVIFQLISIRTIFPSN